MALSKSIVAGSLALLMVGTPGYTQQEAQQAIPDAPRPQTNIPIRNVAPGQGSTSSTSNSESDETPAAPAPAAPSTTVAATPNAPQPQPAAADDQPLENLTTFVARVNYVIIPFTVKDNKGNLIAGLKRRDVQVFENGREQNIRFFTVDPAPMSVALVIDQSMAQENMDRVNSALGALQGAFTNYDEISVFTYNKAPKQI